VRGRGRVGVRVGVWVGVGVGVRVGVRVEVRERVRVEVRVEVRAGSIVADKYPRDAEELEGARGVAPIRPPAATRGLRRAEPSRVVELGPRPCSINPSLLVAGLFSALILLLQLPHGECRLVARPLATS
jgi:hypothetical protein